LISRLAKGHDLSKGVSDITEEKGTGIRGEKSYPWNQ
jgi:hypothetical protein